jgi:hypothetical protein
MKAENVRFAAICRRTGMDKLQIDKKASLEERGLDSRIELSADLMTARQS